MTRDILIWWLVVQAIGLAGLPLTQFLFRSLPDRGYAFSKTLGLLLSGYLAWLLAMLGLAPFGATLLALSALAVGCAGLSLVQGRRVAASTASDRASLGIVAAPARTRLPALTLRDTLVSWLRGNWRMVLGYEALFAAALIFLALLRSHDLGFVGPNPWGTERPMDYALFNAIRRSTTFPPHDPWLAGYSLNYYYFGYLLMASMSLLSGIEPAVAYNLSLALIFALTALGAAGIVTNLISLTENQEPPRGYPNENRGPRHPTPVLGSWLTLRVPVLLTVVLVLFAGNQGGALQVITGTEMAVALDGPDLARAIANGLGPRQPLTLQKTFRGDYFDGTSVITPTSITIAADNFNWWNSTRAVWDDYTRRGDPSRHYAITEFPFFSFWLGDMHPHVMALPFGLLALALALQTLARPAAPAFAMGRRGWLDLALTGLVLGSLYVTNSWDFPTYVLLFLGALLLLYVRLGSTTRSTGAPSPPHPLTPSPLHGIWWQHYARQAVMVLVAAVTLFAPFYLTFHSLVGRKESLVNLPILATLTRTLGFVTWSKTPLYSFLIIFGLFLVPLVGYLIVQGRYQGQQVSEPAGDQEIEEPPTAAPVAPSPRQPVTADLLRILPYATLVVFILGPLLGFPLLALLPLAIYAAMLAVKHAARAAAAFVLLAFALGCLICFGTEVIYIRDVFEARLNTIFKFYYQVWLIWGVLAGYALWWLAVRRRMSDRTENRERAPAGSTENHPEGTRPRTEEPPRGYPTTRRVPDKEQGTTDHGPRTTDHGRGVGRWVLLGLFGVLFAVLLAGALVYPWLTISKAFREGAPVGLAGKTPRESTPDGAAAIAWLRANTAWDAVILEAVGDPYNNVGFGGVSASTGLATVLGWPGHEDQWRGGDPAGLAQIGPRRADVTDIYSTTDAQHARELLQKYNVRYVYVGELERQGFSPESLAKFDQLGDVAFQQGEVTIYHVK
jgi:YYY domain-containing protein